MSLSTRIAIGPSRTLALAEAVMVAGAVTVTATTAAARLLADGGPWTLGLAAGAAVVIGIALGTRQWKRRTGSCGHEIIIGELGELSVRRFGHEVVPRPSARSFQLSDASTVWPGFAVLSLSTAPSAGSHGNLRSRILHLPVVRREIKRGDARRLHRYLLWVQRGAPHRAGLHAEDALG